MPPIIQKMEKSVKTLTFRVVLDSLRTVYQVFDTFFSFSLIRSNFVRDQIHGARNYQQAVAKYKESWISRAD